MKLCDDVQLSFSQSVSLADELDSIGSTVTQRRALKIREYFRIWVKVESFTITMLSLTCSCRSMYMCRDYTQICVQSLIFHPFTWSSIFKRPAFFFPALCVYARSISVVDIERHFFFDIKIALNVAVNVLILFFFFLISVANRWIEILKLKTEF